MMTSRSVHRLAVRLLTATAAILLTACGGTSDDAAPAPPPPAAPAKATFSFLVRGKSADERFVHTTSSPALMVSMRAQLALPREQRREFPAGRIAAGNGGFNLQWGWHFTEVSLVENAVEVCDGSPSMVQANLDYWLNTVRNFCPWSAYVDAEVE